jgi:tripartite-type tricarboxylate transporter receptor subunit TctC
VMFGTMTFSSAAGQIRAGKVLPIAVSSKLRVREFPDVPTLRELGYDDIVANTWYGLSGPAGLAEPVVLKLYGAAQKFLALPDVKERFDKDAIEAEPMTTQDFTRFMASEVAKWGPIAKKLGTAPNN